MRAQLLVLAKAPVPGLVKTRLCPPCTPVQAAAIAAAALADTLDAGGAARYVRRTLVLSGRYEPPRGWAVVAQRGTGLGERLAYAYADTAVPGVATILIGMDTPQVTGPILDDLRGQLAAPHTDAVRGPAPHADAVLGPALDGGWWALGLRDARYAAVLRDVPMSTSDTGARTIDALRAAGLRVVQAPALRDVDTVPDAYEVAALATGTRFAAAVRREVPTAPAFATEGRAA
jgi:glycosyltransferase A (GT-A) superfamily protein (DUF2064 family)